MMRAWERVRSWVPWTTKKRAARALALLTEQHRREMDALRAQHAWDLEREHARVDNLMERIQQTNWHRDPNGVYSLVLKFSPELAHRMNRQGQLGFLAQMLARQVQAEIETGQFIRAR